MSDGRLHRVHRGVYAVGHRRLTQRGLWVASVLAPSQRSALSNLCAAANLGLVDSFPSVPQVTTVSWHHPLPGIQLHCAALDADEVIPHNRIPTTSVQRTILDVSATAGQFRAERVIAKAEFRELIGPEGLAEMIDRYRGRRGIAAVRRIHEARLPSLGVTESELEERFLRFLDGNGLPRPELNVWMELAGARIRVDCLWRAQRVIVELDGRAAHIRAAAFEADRLRDRRLTAAGWRPMRVTWRHLDDEAGLARDLRETLAVAGPPKPSGDDRMGY